MEDTIYKGDRGQNFINTIRNVLLKGNIKEKYIQKLLEDDSLELYNIAFTHKSADLENNYEFLELLGDQSANRNIVWYLSRRFPQINCPSGTDILSRLKIKYVSKKPFGNIGKRMGFWDYVTISKKLRETNMNKILEDVFEAFIGATEKILDSKFIIGVGNSITYDIISYFFDQMDISLKYEELYDSKTRLKEFVDSYNSKDNYLENKKMFSKVSQGLVTKTKKYTTYINLKNTLSWLNQSDPDAYKMILEKNSPYILRAKLEYETRKIDNDKQMSVVKISGIYNTKTNTALITPTIIGRGEAYLQVDAEQAAAKKGIKYLEEFLGELKVPEIYKKLCNFDQINKLKI